MFTSAERTTFFLGTVLVIHDAAHAFDVELESSVVTKVPAGGLEFDSRK